MPTLILTRKYFRVPYARFMLICAMLLIALMASGCGERYQGKAAYSLDMRPPEGPPEYQQGWKDGCETGIAANTTDFYKFFNKIKMDPELIKNPVYRRVWTDAYNYCWFFTDTTLLYPI